MSTPDDELLRKAALGDRDALSTLIERHGPAVRQRFKDGIPKRWQSVLSLDDLMQEAYTDAFHDITAFVPRGVAAFKGWLETIAKHNLLNAIQMLEAEKRGGKRRRIGLHPYGDSSVALYERLVGTKTTPSRHAARNEAQGALEGAIVQLPEDYRQVVRLYDLEGRPVAEVSSALKRSPGAVFMLRARAHRALCRLLGSPSRYLTDFA